MIHEIVDKVEQAVGLLSAADNLLKDLHVTIETEYTDGKISNSDLMGYSGIILGFEMDAMRYAHKFGSKHIKLMQLSCQDTTTSCDEKASNELADRKDTDRLLVK